MPVITAGSRPRLRRGIRLVFDASRGTRVVLYPEGVLVPNQTAAEILSRCDGATTVASIAASLAAEFDGVRMDDVLSLLDRVSRTPVHRGRPGRTASAGRAGRTKGTPMSDASVNQPLGLLAELTYRCPLHCAYCSNPVNLDAYRDELTTAQWKDVFTQARELGVLQLHLSGGEPLARPDLRELVAHAHGLGLYLNLVTAALSLTEETATALADAGLDHVQISVQDADPVNANAIAGVRGHDRKLAAAAVVKKLGLPLTANVVLHRGNLDRIAEIIDLAEAMDADRLELANTQYYGWGLVNRTALMPTKAQLDHAQAVAAAARRRLGRDR